MWRDNLKAKRSQRKGFRFSRTGEEDEEGDHVQVTRASFEGWVKDRGSFYEAISFQPMGNRYTGIYLSSYFHFLFAKFGYTDVQYSGPPSPSCTAPHKSCSVGYTHRRQSKMEGEASQTTAKSRWSWFKQEMGNTTCLEVAFCLCSPTFIYRQRFQSFYCQQLRVEIVQISTKSTSC